MILGTIEGGLVQIDPKVEAVIETFVSEREILLEAGGILIGSYRGPHVVIDACTAPLPADCRLRNLFDRRDAGHHRDPQQSGKNTFMISLAALE
ncbi:hypothetical protein GCM10025880_43400 [Methylorubrum aminovorans]|uniref:hypothetical protein n=1 Tax=Methylorubrum aminovorans TaxID=269069 RepID=UPI0023E9DE38|nr:hypothetical protein [Methylorubrum aminovorans]GMA77923.1 hypothetical protein GCM10025880_43400 [Methylorubrum aminovorans]